MGSAIIGVSLVDFFFSKTNTVYFYVCFCCKIFLNWFIDHVGVSFGPCHMQVSSVKKKLFRFCALFWLCLALAHMFFFRGALNVCVVGPQTCVSKWREQL